MRPIGLVIDAAAGIAPQYSGGQSPPGFWPVQIRHAYGFDQLSLDGTGQTIAIVDAYHDPNMANDLAKFDAQFNLPAPPSLTQVNENGGSASSVPPDPSGGWEVEESLDVEWAHAIAPGAKILLVEATTASTSDLLAAVDTARTTPGVVAVSMSWGGAEDPTESNFDAHFTTPSGHVGVTFLASSGDQGAPGGWPAVSANVIAVGGTTLTLNASDNPTSEVGWSGSGGGFSSYLSQPGYQTTYANSSYVRNTLGNSVLLTNKDRGIPDVAYAADSAPGFATYDSYPYQGSPLGWVAVGGTSDAAPQWAALIALVDQGRGAAGSLDGPTQTLPALYQLAASPTAYPNDFSDITKGSNGATAQAGYDLVTGLGSPRANNLIPDLEKAGISTVLNVTTTTSTPTAGTAFGVTVTAQNAAGQTLTGYRGTIHFTTSDTGSGFKLPGDYTFTAADQGTHTFPGGVTLVTAGSQTVTATDTSSSSISGQASVTVTPAAASTLAVSAPTNSTPGTAFSVTVTAKDPYGNTVTTYAGTVHFTTSDTGAGVKLPADYAFGTGDHGAHTFTNGVTLITVGNQTVTATDTQNAALTGSATVNVQAAQSATHFSVSAPTPDTAGSAFSVTVTALDANNNTAVGYGGTVHFTTSDKGSGVKLPADYTFTTADHGVHTFASAVTLVTAGSQTVTVTDTHTSKITGSAGVTVTPATATKLAVAGFPSPVAPGFQGTFTVTAKDAYGNTATGYSGTVVFSSSDPQAGLPPISPLTNGVGTFTALFATPGTQSLTATDTVKKSITGTQSGIVVSQAAPVVLNVMPNSGPITGGYTAMIFGLNLGGATAAYFGTTPAIILVANGLFLQVQVPAHAAGTVDVTVVTPAGTSPIASGDKFTYLGGSALGPTVTGVLPPEGPTSGGYQVVVSGTNLGGATAVYFGSTPGVIQFDSATSMTVTVPAHAAGTVDVTVVTPQGTSPTSPADLFTYQGGPPTPASGFGPSVKKVSSTFGATTGLYQVTISGTNLSGAKAVYFGKTLGQIRSVSSSSLVVLVPAHAAGLVDVTVVTPSGTSPTSAADQFLYASGLGTMKRLAVLDTLMAQQAQTGQGFAAPSNELIASALIEASSAALADFVSGVVRVTPRA